MSKFAKAAVVAALTIGAQAGFAASGSTTLSLTDPAAPYTSSAATPNRVFINGSDKPAIADELRLSATNIPGLTGSFAAYCMDFGVNLHLPGAYTFTDTALDSVARLFAVTGFNGYKYATDGVVTNTQQAALQIAIWEVTKDSLSGFDLDSGGFSVTTASAATKTLAAQYLNQALTLKSGYSQVRAFYSAEVAGNQPLVTTVPEPSTYAMLAACLGVIGLVMRRKSV